MTAPLDIAALRGLLERLRATVHRGKFALGGGSIRHDGKGTMWGGERIMEQANPDGNQAATAIEALLARVAELEGALRPFADALAQSEALPSRSIAQHHFRLARATLTKEPTVERTAK